MDKRETCICGHARISHRNLRGGCYNTNIVGYPCLCIRFKRPDKSFIESRYHPYKWNNTYDELHERIVVQDKKGLVWEITYAEPFPTDEEVLKLFKENKKAFEPHYYKR